MSYSVEPPPPRADGYRTLVQGDPAPWFEQAASAGQLLALEQTAGHYLVLCFFFTAADARGQRALAFLEAQHAQALASEKNLQFYGVSGDWRDQAEARIKPTLGLQCYWDFDLSIMRRYGVVPVNAAPGPVSARRMWCVLDPALRVLAVLRFEREGGEQAALLELLRSLPANADPAREEAWAPILHLPNVFEADFCRQLVQLHERDGGTESGFLREVEGKTVEIHEHRHKRRVDYLVNAPGVIAEIEARLVRRVVPELAKAYQFKATRVERYLVGCYRAEQAGHFSAHRDNTTTRTQHRRFALSVNLNDDYEGGELGFPEYGSRRYQPRAGAAIVFSCSLLHSVSPVTRGNRYAFLPFLHDEAAHQLLLDHAL